MKGENDHQVVGPWSKGVAWFFAVLSFLALIFTGSVGLASDIYQHVPVSWIFNLDDSGRLEGLSFWAWAWVIFTVAGIFACIVFLLNTWMRVGHASINRDLSRQAELLRARNADLEDAMRASMATVAHAVETWRISSTTGTEAWRYTKLEERYEVEDDSTTTAIRTYEIEALDTVVGFPIYVFADPEAEPAALLRDIDFLAYSLDGDGTDVQYLLTENGTLKKSVALVFIPPIQPGERRRFRTKYRWKRFASNLVSKAGETDFVLTFRSYDPTDTADTEIEFFFAAGLGPIEMSMPQGAPGVLTTNANVGSENTVWLFKDAALPVHDRKLLFTAKRTAS